MQEGFLEAWQESEHADFFDARATLSARELRRCYESFNEFRLFLDHKGEIEGRLFVEIGCATGELYRYLRQYHPEFHYRGYDISHSAIARARQKFPEGRFDTCEPDLSDLRQCDLKPSVLWVRDVVHHQPDPFEYLSKLLPLSEEITILRIRTRDRGPSVIDPERSCQRHYDYWVPYIVLNTDEIVEFISHTIPVESMFVLKNHVQLGGWNNRYLPKDCYYPETGTAETAIYIVRAEAATAPPDIVISDHTEEHRR